ncbi:hypothetical protein ACWC0A_31945 [Streptomyces scopuliridis]
MPRADSVGTVPVTVVTAGGRADGVSYTYEANPVTTGLDPTSGPASGGTAVVSDTEIVAVAPPEVAGAADIVIQSPGSNADMPSAYTYLAGPGI